MRELVTRESDNDKDKEETKEQSSPTSNTQQRLLTGQKTLPSPPRSLDHCGPNLSSVALMHVQA